MNNDVTSDTFHILYFSASSPEDYTAVTEQRERFPPCTSEICINIATNDDELVEGEETFTVSLKKSDDLDQRISIGRSTSTVAIEDEDCEWLSCLQLFCSNSPLPQLPGSASRALAMRSMSRTET